MKPKHIKKLLMSEIRKVASEPYNYCTNPDTDFTRSRKLSMEKMLQGIIGMESKCLTNELLDLFGASADTPTTSAFIQRRSRIKPTAFEPYLKNFQSSLWLALEMICLYLLLMVLTSKSLPIRQMQNLT